MYEFRAVPTVGRLIANIAKGVPMSLG
ncbi:hypothetical protein RHCRD62_70246 [Rhodococcus sp. RD6.2]|nr:hypothetical protein RHCRD62_70246 [Rhodococcus sp. RD6.2]